MIVDNDNQSEIPTSRGEERHHSIVPFGNKGSAPFDLIYIKNIM